MWPCYIAFSSSFYTFYSSSRSLWALSGSQPRIPCTPYPEPEPHPRTSFSKSEQRSLFCDQQFFFYNQRSQPACNPRSSDLSHLNLQSDNQSLQPNDHIQQICFSNLLLRSSLQILCNLVLNAIWALISNLPSDDQTLQFGDHIQQMHFSDHLSKHSSPQRSGLLWSNHSS